MENIKLHQSELRVMNLLWTKGNLAASDIAKILKEEYTNG